MPNIISKADDSRKIAIYARKSKLTEQGKSIENQITMCRNYAAIHLNVDKSDIITYIDEGLSGFYSDRPNYQRLLHDVADNKIRALICYKFDRISRKTLDLLNLVDKLKSKKIDFISCSDNIDTSTTGGNMMISLLATIAEFERDIIAERISDNMYELAKDGRWLGGTTPTGYLSEKEHIRLHGRKTSINHLKVIPDEFEMVKSIFQMFLKERSLIKVCDALNEQGKRTKGGKKFSWKLIKPILQNPVYAAADLTMYQYFDSLGLPVYSPKEVFDGVHGLMVYNKTEQIKKLKDDSTFADTKYVQQTLRKDIHDWIVSIGEHIPAVSGEDWLCVQSILRANVDKYNRPNQQTFSLLSGLLICPICSGEMCVRSNSGRYTKNGKLQYRYVCKRKLSNHSNCPDSRNLNGNELDTFVINTICNMSNPDSYYYKLLNDDKALVAVRSSELALSILDTQKQIGQIKKDIESQVRNLRSASDVVKKVICGDIESLTQNIEQKNALLSKLKEEQQQKERQSVDIEEVKKIIMSFPTLVKLMPYEQQLELIQKIISHVVVLGDDIHIYLKGTESDRMCHSEQNSK